MYRFQHVLSFAQIFPIYGLPSVCEKRSCHASEVPFVFHNHANYSFATSELPLADAFISYWSAFAHTGDVNGGGGGSTGPVHWPRYTGASRLNMRLAIDGDPGGGLGVESTNGEGQPGTAPGTGGVCDFFDSIGYDW